MLNENALGDPEGMKKHDLTTEVPASDPLTASTVGEEATTTPKEGFSESEIAELKSRQRRYLVYAVIAGIVLAVLGFFAGGNAREKVDGADAPTMLVTAAPESEEFSYVR